MFYLAKLASHMFFCLKLKVNTRTCVLSNKKAESKAPKVQTLKGQRYVKLA